MQTTKHDDNFNTHHETADQALRAALAEALDVDQEQVAGFDAETALFGALPQLDSMAVATLLTDLEDRLDIVIDDDDVDAEVFETFGTLAALLARKLETRGA